MKLPNLRPPGLRKLLVCARRPSALHFVDAHKLRPNHFNIPVCRSGRPRYSLLNPLLSSLHGGARIGEGSEWAKGLLGMLTYPFFSSGSSRAVADPGAIQQPLSYAVISEMRQA